MKYICVVVLFSNISYSNQFRLTEFNNVREYSYLKQYYNLYVQNDDNSKKSDNDYKDNINDKFNTIIRTKQHKSILLQEYPNSCYSLRYNPQKPRDYFFIPLISFIFPGFDQWWEGQYKYAALYSGIAAGSLIYYKNVRVYSKKELEDIQKESDKQKFNRQFHNERQRKIIAAGQLYSLSGGLSLYHSFRSAVRTRQSQGEFLFLQKEESISEIAMAPFRLHYLTRTTTLVPLAIGTGLLFLQQDLYQKEVKKKDSEIEKDPFSISDVFYTGFYSYNAGVWEEAAFRGWMLPVTYEWMKNSLLSNITTALVFAALHASEVKVPVFQFCLGYYLGYLTKKNDWTISESVFIHTWWDVLAFINIFRYKYKEDVQSVPTLYLPSLIVLF